MRHYYNDNYYYYRCRPNANRFLFRLKCTQNINKRHTAKINFQHKHTMTTHQDSESDEPDRLDMRRPALYELVVPSKEDANGSGETMTLRVRKPQYNVNGSILLLSSSGDV
jgi:hypothetical protein